MLVECNSKHKKWCPLKNKCIHYNPHEELDIVQLELGSYDGGDCNEECNNTKAHFVKCILVNPVPKLLFTDLNIINYNKAQAILDEVTKRTLKFLNHDINKK